jgi:hypothetical protein
MDDVNIDELLQTCRHIDQRIKFLGRTAESFSRDTHVKPLERAQVNMGYVELLNRVEADFLKIQELLTLFQEVEPSDHEKQRLVRLTQDCTGHLQKLSNVADEMNDLMQSSKP